MVVCLLCTTYSVEAEEVKAKEAVAENSAKVLEDNSEIVIDCKTFLTIQQVLVDATSSADSVVALISVFRTQIQLNTKKLTEAQTREEFDDYRQFIRGYSEKIMTLEKQQAELQESVTFIGQQIERIRQNLPYCEPQNSEQVE